MQAFNDFSDERQKSWCIHCGQPAARSKMNRDHVPTKSLLDDPLPDNLPIVQICQACNTSFSPDEEYVRTFLSCVLCGSTAPEAHESSEVGRALQRSPALRERIERTRREYRAVDGRTKIVWLPETSPIERVVVKNARGHAYYETGEPMLAQPRAVWLQPLELMTVEERANFENAETSGWAEVGSRMMQRQALLSTGLLASGDLEDGWVTVQDAIYRYAVIQEGVLTVRSVIRDYLAAEVRWD
jgi:hypothetical protein